MIRKLPRRWLALMVPLALAAHSAAPNSSEQNWTNFTRIAAYGLKSDNAAQIVENAQQDHVFGIEVDNDIEGRYESFVDTTEKLKAIRAVAEKAHAAANYAF